MPSPSDPTADPVRLARRVEAVPPEAVEPGTVAAVDGVVESVLPEGEPVGPTVAGGARPQPSGVPEAGEDGEVVLAPPEPGGTFLVSARRLEAASPKG